LIFILSMYDFINLLPSTFLISLLEGEMFKDYDCFDDLLVWQCF